MSDLAAVKRSRATRVLAYRARRAAQALPPHVDADLAVSEGWWKDPDYILYELNINSTISSPGHDERIPLAQTAPYKMQGYAYSGGGRKITRVEVSFDGGAPRDTHACPLRRAVLCRGHCKRRAGARRQELQQACEAHHHREAHGVR